MRAENSTSWAGDRTVGVTLTFDVDAETPLLAKSAGYAHRLTSLSEARYGLRRALPRILELLRTRELKATFYIPGAVVDRYPSAILAILDAGHEIGHHGHKHLRTDGISPGEEREEIEQGLSAMERVAGVRPEGYRSPCWELTAETVRLLFEYGFRFDSSLMEDDRPYVLKFGTQRLLELPCHWSLDDWPYFGWDGEEGGSMGDTSVLARNWLEEYASARRDRRHITYTMHPEIIGRGYRFEVLTSLVDSMLAEGDTLFATHGEIAARINDLEDQALGDPVELEL